MSSRLLNHAALAALTIFCFGITAVAGPAAELADRFSIVSAYLCLFLLGGVLLIGPLHAIRKGRPITNSHTRRDMAIWAALAGLLHFYLANVLSMNYEYLAIYVENAAVSPSAEIRADLYSWGTILGYVIAVLFVILLGLSNDRMVRIMGLKWWKRIQRASYFAFLFTCAHAFAFQILESRAMLWVFVVLLATALIVFAQAFGFSAVRKVRAK